MEAFEMYSILLWDIVEPTAFVAVIILLWRMVKTLKEIERELRNCGK